MRAVAILAQVAIIKRGVLWAGSSVPLPMLATWSQSILHLAEDPSDEGDEVQTCRGLLWQWTQRRRQCLSDDDEFWSLFMDVCRNWNRSLHDRAFICLRHLIAAYPANARQGFCGNIEVRRPTRGDVRGLGQGNFFLVQHWRVLRVVRSVRERRRASSDSRICPSKASCPSPPSE